MPKLPDEIGKKYGRLTCLGYAEPRKSKQGSMIRMMLCKCDCGGEKVAIATAVRGGRTISCGCAAIDSAKKIKHGRSRRGSRRDPLYNLWGQMRSRCNDAGSTSFKHYGGRGIKVCDQWSDFKRFSDDMGPRPPGHSIDRINPDGDYEPSNCRWADKTTQANNKRGQIKYEFNGERLTVAQIAKNVGLNPYTIRARLKRGVEPESAFKHEPRTKVTL